jgi:SET domain-containing protein 6
MGIWWDPSLISLTPNCSQCSGPAFGIHAVNPIQEGQLLCIIPKTAILSPKTSALAAVLEEEQIGGGLALTIAAMYEAALGPKSKW